jgi:hypothetical protein
MSTLTHTGRYLGRYRLGQTVPLLVATIDTGFLAVAPDTAPTYAVHRLDDDVNTVAATKMTLTAESEDTHLFNTNILVDRNYSPGQYAVEVSYDISSATHVEIWNFEVTSGGDRRGTPIALYSFEQHNGEHIVAMTDTGHVAFGRQPK